MLDFQVKLSHVRKHTKINNEQTKSNKNNEEYDLKLPFDQTDENRLSDVVFIDRKYYVCINLRTWLRELNENFYLKKKKKR